VAGLWTKVGTCGPPYRSDAQPTVSKHFKECSKIENANQNSQNMVAYGSQESLKVTKNGSV